MFTGIIVDQGIVSELNSIGDDLRIRVQTPLSSKMQLGGSISVSGVCLTVTDLSKTDFCADISAETLRCTMLGELKVQDLVNLEPAITVESVLGGHLVSGHVDGIGRVEAIEPEGRSYRYSISAPQVLHKYIAVKGSIAIDGVSLTVNSVDAQGFTVNIIPHTLEQTTFRLYEKGTEVNLEVDLLARYLERLLESRSS